MKRTPAVALLLLAALALVAMTVPAARNPRVELYVNLAPAPGSFGFQLLQSDSAAIPFVLPPNTRLVVTDVIMAPNAFAGIMEADLFSAGADTTELRLRLDSVRDSMLHLPFTTGLVFRSAPRTRALVGSPPFTLRLLGTLEQD